MAQAQSIAQARDNPLNREGLCVLSLGKFLVFVDFAVANIGLDGGGVRGLSSLLIIQALMANVNAEREKDGHSSVKPCELFDLIGGTSTGG
jgi:Patatin-like phospholipase